MKHLKAANHKAHRVETAPAAKRQVPEDVLGMAQPMGCTTIFNPGWEANPLGRHCGHVRANGGRPAWLCQCVLVAGSGARQPAKLPRVGQCLFGCQRRGLAQLGAGLPREEIAAGYRLKIRAVNNEGFPV